ncbi:hypothetical protein [Mesorhizobium helmanticense]|uniref:Uncharacterized protein n=1 Tax=Mesorhizobium helmanticense TaxID=1776423 RepID=A0A2T4IN37_9HYPH|nr:hypothetical protein [Mesorhizobium helmanticense]PTE07025.1 hypothetical protein C9427_28835 [Mesorhizobium helmanticense]
MNDEGDRPKLTGKALRVNDNSVGERDAPSLPVPPKPRTGSAPQKVEGNALRVNDNSVEGEQPAPSQTPSHKG